MKKLSIIITGFILTTKLFAADFQEPFKNGMIITEWDLAFPDQATKDRYEMEASDKLIINLKGPGVFDTWSASDKMRLTYCVSDKFGDNKKDVVEALDVSTKDWMAVANVRFAYVPSEDGSCTASNNKVMFDVNPVNMGQYLARSFFPSYPRKTRSLMVDASSFKFSIVAISGFIRHELGHILGFRHEQISKQSPGLCPEDNNFSPVTDYDPTSVMHYPQCGGKNNLQDMILSELDKEGAGKIYPF